MKKKPHKKRISSRSRDEFFNSESMYKAILRAIPDMMFIINSKGDFVDFKYSKKEERVLKPSKIIKKNIRDIGLSRTDLKNIRACMRKTLCSRKLQNVAYQLSIDGRLHYYEGRMMAISSKEILSLVRDITDQILSQRALQHKVRFENLITNISARFINVSTEKIEKEITSSLKAIGEFVDVDRVYIFSAYDEYARADITHEWCRKGVEKQIKKHKGLRAEDFPWFAKRLIKGEVLYCPDVDALPAKAKALKKLQKSQDIKSFLVVPMIYGGTIAGFLGFDSVRNRKVWDEEHIHLLKIVSEVYLNALQRKKFDDMLMSSESRFRSLFEESPFAVWEQDFSGVKKYIESLRKKGVKDFRKYFLKHLREVRNALKLLHVMGVNKAALQLYRAKNKKEFAEKVLIVESEGAFQMTLEGLIAFSRGQRLFESEGYHRTLKGDDIAVRLKCSLSSCVDGKCDRMITSVIDITEKKRSDQNLQHRYEFEKLIASISTNFINISDKMVDAEIEKALKLLGMFLDVDRSYVFLFHDNGEKMSNTHEWCGEGVRSYIKENKDLPCAYFSWFTEKLKKRKAMHIPRISALPLEAKNEKREFIRQKIVSLVFLPMIYKGKTIGFLGLDRVRKEKNWTENDIVFLKIIGEIFTGALERRRIAQETRDSEEKFRTFAEKSPNIIFINKRGKVVYVNEKCVKVMGYSRKEFYSHAFDFMCLIDPADHDQISHAMKKHIRGEYVPAYEYRIITKKGKKIEALIMVNLIPYEGEKAILGVVTDITSQKYSEKALRESEERYRTLVETSPDAIILADLKGRILMVNAQAICLHGFDDAQEMIGMPFFTLIAFEERQRALKDMQLIIDGGKTEIVEYTFLKKDYRCFLGELRASLILDSEGRPSAIISVIRDITEKKKMQEEIIKVQKMESLGLLAGGIAHDFNNILMGITGNISLAKMKTSIKGENMTLLEDAEKAAQHARTLTQQLLTFSKGGMPVRKQASIKDLLVEAVSFSLRGSNIRCIFSVPDDLMSVEIDYGQISQVINNLIINAEQAMSDGGVIRIYGVNIHVRSKKQEPFCRGRFVKISIMDEGQGILEKHQEKIFDPFFTTKSCGSGLGLTTTYSIIKKHDGYITFDSTPGKGTTFSIYLPTVKKRFVPEKSRKAKILGGRGRVLLMDDEDVVLRTGMKMLRYLGYQTVLAKNGKEALVIYKRAFDAGEKFMAVIMDLTIPGGMGGNEVVKKILNIDPRAKIIVSSGYSNDPIMSDFQSYGFCDVMAKPYNIEDMDRVLIKIVRKMK